MQDMTTGSVTHHLLKTTSFMLVTMVFQTLYFLIDLYWVGHLGKEAVAAMFQAMGNTIPPLITSFARLLLVMVPAIILSRANGFTLTWIWYLSACAIGAQMLLNLALLRREFRGKLEG
jgi:Na+-driven multidrug efflux pump